MKKNLVLFDNVDEIEPSLIKWDKIRYQKNNQHYWMLLNVCYMVLTGLILSMDKG